MTVSALLRTDEAPPCAAVEPAPPSQIRATMRVDACDSEPCLLTAEEQALLRAVRAGDSSAAAPFFDCVRPAIEQSLTRVLRKKPTDFEDLVQTTLERVIRSIAEDKFRGQSQLKTWAYSIADHVAKDWLRRCAAEQRLMEVVELSHARHLNHPELTLEARSELRRVRRVLSRMKRLNASTLVLHDVYDHTVPEVALMLDLSVSAAESRLRRARMELARRSQKRITPDEIATA